MERSPNISWLFHFRIISLMVLLGILDFLFVSHAYHSILTRGASVQLVFGFEYAILMTMVLTIFIKYVLHSIDLQNENPWDSKAVYMLYTELFTGNLEEARRILRCFEEAVPGLAMVRLRRVSLERRHGQLERAEALLTEAMEANAGLPLASFYGCLLYTSRCV
ncbi:hypothetical protein AAES_41068 [Amazona aestiva]|uniref:E3 ubiquitin-protein ligase synoviolin-like TPR repeats domain-containing protein n=1 Tax=Amazona aestiva TaxID=12930 RepID=A0A0Q3PVY7_AMAAE|nr:hypothetical protein AAES_41068 [Amazona aestiva]